MQLLQWLFSKSYPSSLHLRKIRHQSTSRSVFVRLVSGSNFTATQLPGQWPRKLFLKALLKKINCLLSCQSTGISLKACSMLNPVYIKYQSIVLRQLLCLKATCWTVLLPLFWMESLHILLSFEMTCWHPTAVKAERAFALHKGESRDSREEMALYVSKGGLQESWGEILH